MDYSEVSIIVPTFLRDGCLINTLGRIQQYLAECKVIVVDDGYQTQAKDYLYNMMRQDGHQAVYMPFDSGIAAKRNVGVRLANTEYVVIASDDYNFEAVSRSDFTMWYKALQSFCCYVAGGRVNNRPYEGFLTMVNNVMHERLWQEGDTQSNVDGITIHSVDIVCNYFMTRRKFLLRYPWDEQFKIGGEHGDFFWRIKQAWQPRRVVAYVPGTNVNQFELDPRLRDVAFPVFRARAMQYHLKFMKKWGIKEYKGIDPTSNVRLN